MTIPIFCTDKNRIDESDAMGGREFLTKTVSPPLRKDLRDCDERIAKAAKKLTFEYLDETQGLGWWGNNANKDFYENLSDEDNPWNWVRVLRGFREAGLPGDHAGIYECSVMESLYPGSIKLNRLAETDDWFAQGSKDMSAQLGKERVETLVDVLVERMRPKKEA